MSPLPWHGTCHEGLPKSASLHCNRRWWVCSASDVEDEVALVTNLAAPDYDEATAKMGDEVLGTAATANYRTIIVQRVLSAQIK